MDTMVEPANRYLIVPAVLVPLLLLTCLLLLLYLCCSKRLRLNWFHRVLLEESEAATVNAERQSFYYSEDKNDTKSVDTTTNLLSTNMPKHEESLNFSHQQMDVEETASTKTSDSANTEKSSFYKSYLHTGQRISVPNLGNKAKCRRPQRKFTAAGSLVIDKRANQRQDFNGAESKTAPPDKFCVATVVRLCLPAHAFNATYLL